MRDRPDTIRAEFRYESTFQELEARRTGGYYGDAAVYELFFLDGEPVLEAPSGARLWLEMVPPRSAIRMPVRSDSDA